MNVTVHNIPQFAIISASKDGKYHLSPVVPIQQGKYARRTKPLCGVDVRNPTWDGSLLFQPWIQEVIMHHNLFFCVLCKKKFTKRHKNKQSGPTLTVSVGGQHILRGGQHREELFHSGHPVNFSAYPKVEAGPHE